MYCGESVVWMLFILSTVLQPQQCAITVLMIGCCKKRSGGSRSPHSFFLFSSSSLFHLFTLSFRGEESGFGTWSFHSKKGNWTRPLRLFSVLQLRGISLAVRKPMQNTWNKQQSCICYTLDFLPLFSLVSLTLKTLLRRNWRSSSAALIMIGTNVNRERKIVFKTSY